MNIYTRLNFIILLVLIPLLLLQLVSTYSLYKNCLETELHASQELVEAISATFSNYLEDIWSLERTIYLTINIKERELTDDEAEKFMRNLLIDKPTIRHFAVVDLTGKIITSTKSFQEDVVVSDRNYIQRILQGEEKVVSELLISRASNQLAFIAARAIRENGKLTAITVAEIDITKLDFIFPVNRVGEFSEFGIVDSSEMIVYRNTTPNLSLDERLLTMNSPVHLALSGKIFYSEYHHQKRIGVHLPLENISWTVYATASVDEVLQGIRFEITRDLIVLLIVAGGSLIVGSIIGKRSLQPILSLQKAAQAISDGDLTARTNIIGVDELSKTGIIFDQMADQIQKLEQSRTRFLQTAAHELRNPMAGIKGILSLVRLRIAAGKTMEDITPMLGVMDQEIDRLSKLLNKILEAFKSHKEGEMMQLSFEKINLRDLIFSTLKPYQMAGLDHKFHFESSKNKIWVLGDSARLEEVIRNLLGNAIKYSPQESEVFVQLSIFNNMALIAVKDQGIGVPEDQIKQIFEGFYRADNFPLPDPGGMGLGLYICKEIIQSHKGKIWAKRNKDKGSTFYVTIPLFPDKEGKYDQSFDHGG